MPSNSYYSAKKRADSVKDSFWFYLLLFLIFWAPIPLGSNRPWAWGILEIGAYITLTGCMWTHREHFFSALSPFKWPILIFVLFILWTLVQSIALPATWVQVLSPNTYALYEATQLELPQIPLSVDAGQTTVGVLKSFSYLCLFLSTLLLCRNDERIRLIMLCIVFTGLFQAVYGALEVLLGNETSWIFSLPIKNVATGTFVYKNHFANYLMLSLSIGVGYLVSTLNNQSASSKKEFMRNVFNTLLNGKAVIRIALAIMVIALVMSRSRMGNTAFFASMTITGFLGLFLIKNRSKGLTILIISMFIIDMFILSAWFGLDKVQERLQHTSFEQEKRDEVVLDSLPLLKDYMYTGSGLGSYYTIFPKYQREDIYAFYDHAHNDYLQFAIEVGVPATLLIGLLPLLAFITSVRALTKRRKTLYQGLAFGCCMAVIGMFTHISVDFPLQAPANSMLFVIILALAFCTKKIERRKKTRSGTSEENS